MSDDEIFDLIIEHDATSGELKDVIAFARAIAAIEREACAIVCETIGDYDENVDEYYSDIYAREIRARGEK
jgi:hypothetical protein